MRGMNLNLHSLHMLEDTFSLGTVHVVYGDMGMPLKYLKECGYT